MTSGARALPIEASHFADEFTFWSAEASGGVTTLRFHDGGLGSGTDVQRTWTLWNFFENLLTHPPTVLRISFPSDGLSHGELFHLWQHFSDLAHQDAAHRFPTCRAQDDLRRENVALARYMTYIRDHRLFVIGDIRGQIDINLLGLLLVCDYRIASRDSVIVNGPNPLGTSFATAVPALLSSITGSNRALDLLLRDEPLSARSALRLGIFHRLTSVDSHEQDAATIATRLSAKGSACLRALKSATVAAAPPLDSHLVATGGAGFNRVPLVPKCEVCGYDLTGNLSGRCPECGHAILRANEHAP